MELYIITIGLILFAVLGITIKIWAKKDGEFAGTCASQSPFLNKKLKGKAYGIFSNNQLIL